MINISENLCCLLQSHSYGTIVTDLLQAAADSGKFDPIKRNEILHKHTFAFKCRYVNDALDAILDYIDIVLEDNILTPEEWTSVRWMRAYLNIDEKDFLKHKKEERIRSIVLNQLKRLYADNIIERDEAIMQSELQGLFGLSSELYSRYVEEVKQEAINNGASAKDLIRNT